MRIIREPPNMPHNSWTHSNQLIWHAFGNMTYQSVFAPLRLSRRLIKRIIIPGVSQSSATKNGQ